MASPMLAPYKPRRAPVSMVPYNPPCVPGSTCPWTAQIMVVPWSAPRAPPRPVPLFGSKYEKCFLRCLFIKAHPELNRDPNSRPWLTSRAAQFRARACSSQSFYMETLKTLCIRSQPFYRKDLWSLKGGGRRGGLNRLPPKAREKYCVSSCTHH
jgi:hypothetical protein